ncbi:MAG: GvpL/GvpF family gas vesicle protein [Terriglobales bacterium]
MADRLNRPNTVLYLYGITRQAERLAASLRGVDGVSTVAPLEASGFTCWISRVDAVEFSDQLARNMENLEWLADASVRHQRVVGAIHERQPILPTRFGTIFLNEESLSEDIAGRKAALLAGFQRIADADEWGIRVFAQPRPAPAASPARTGKEYLQRKATQLQAKPPRALEPEIQKFAAEIVKLAADSAEGGKVGSGQPNLRWQTSILLPRSRRSKFDSLLNRFAHNFADRFRVEGTGPWPPYSFVVVKSQGRQQGKKGKASGSRAPGMAR